MNSRKTNQKIIENLQNNEPIHQESAEEKESEKRSTIEEATKEAPFAFARKVSGVICIALWAFALVAMMTGMAELSLLVPFMLFALAAVCGFNIPVFMMKKKLWDVVVAVAATAVCTIVAVGMLVTGAVY